MFKITNFAFNDNETTIEELGRLKVRKLHDAQYLDYIGGALLARRRSTEIAPNCIGSIAPSLGRLKVRKLHDAQYLDYIGRFAFSSSISNEI